MSKTWLFVFAKPIKNSGDLISTKRKSI